MPPLEVLENVVRGVSGCHSKCESLQAFVGTQYGARRNFCCPSFLFEKYCFSVFTPRYRRSPLPWIVWYEEPDLPQPLRVAFRVSAPASPLGDRSRAAPTPAVSGRKLVVLWPETVLSWAGPHSSPEPRGPSAVPALHPFLL